MQNKPKYNFFKNTNYAIKGLKDLIKTEISFKIEVVISILLLIFIIIIDIAMINKLILFVSLMGVLIAETINSAIERVVDLVTLDYNKMAGRAKDIGSAIVFLSIFVAIVSWIFVLKETSNLLF